jgi:hypothetical protein
MHNVNPNSPPTPFAATRCSKLQAMLRTEGERCREAHKVVLSRTVRTAAPDVAGAGGGAVECAQAAAGAAAAGNAAESEGSEVKGTGKG